MLNKDALGMLGGGAGLDTDPWKISITVGQSGTETVYTGYSSSLGIGSIEVNGCWKVTSPGYFNQRYDSIEKKYTLLESLDVTVDANETHNPYMYFYRPDTGHYFIYGGNTYTLNTPIFTEDDVGKTIDLYLINFRFVNEENCSRYIVPVDITYSGDSYYYIMYFPNTSSTSGTRLSYGSMNKSLVAYIPHCCSTGNDPIITLLGGQVGLDYVDYVASDNLEIINPGYYAGSRYNHTVSFRVLDTTKRASISINTVAD